MKKILFVSVLMVTLLQVRAANFVAQDLLAGSNVLLKDNTTLTFGDTNIYYLRPNGSYTYSYTSTNYVPVYTNSVLLSNLTSVVTNMVSPGAFASSASPGHNFDGTPNSNAALSINGIGVDDGGTNTITVILERSVDGATYDYGTTFTASFLCGGTTNKTLCTNIASAFLTGVKTVRIKSIAANDVAGNSTNTIKSIKLGIWAP